MKGVGYVALQQKKATLCERQLFFVAEPIFQIHFFDPDFDEYARLPTSNKKEQKAIEFMMFS